MYKKIFGRIAPAPVLLFCSQWIGLFSATHFAHPDWEHSVSLTAAGVGAVGCAVLSRLLEGTHRAILRALGAISLVSTGAGFWLCWTYWLALGRAMNASDVNKLKDQWEGAFVLTMIGVVVTLTLVAMWEEDQHPNLFFWIGVIALVLAILILIVTLILR
jgi:hypothetical protein